jgi:hypothetical protein
MAYYAECYYAQCRYAECHEQSTYILCLLIASTLAKYVARLTLKAKFIVETSS